LSCFLLHNLQLLLLMSIEIEKSSKFIKNPVIHVKTLIIMLIQFNFGHILA
jgi:hypothetical protein